MNFLVCSIGLVFVCFAVSRCEARPQPTDICACLEGAPHDEAGEREEAFGLSIAVPFREPMIFHDGVDSSDVEWRHGGESIYLGTAFERRSERFDHPDPDKCMIRVNGRRVLVSEGLLGRERYVLAEFEMPRAQDGRWLSVHALSSRDACLMAAKLAWSLRIGVERAWPREIRVVSISRDRKSFRYEITPGSVAEARVGDVLLGRHMDVKTITIASVTVREWISDGAGGWRTAERVLPLRKRNDTK